MPTNIFDTSGGTLVVKSGANSTINACLARADSSFLVMRSTTAATAVWDAVAQAYATATGSGTITYVAGDGYLSGAASDRQFARTLPTPLTFNGVTGNWAYVSKIYLNTSRTVVSEFSMRPSVLLSTANANGIVGMAISDSTNSLSSDRPAIASASGSFVAFHTVAGSMNGIELYLIIRNTDDGTNARHEYQLLREDGTVYDSGESLTAWFTSGGTLDQHIIKARGYWMCQYSCILAGNYTGSAATAAASIPTFTDLSPFARGSTPATYIGLAGGAATLTPTPSTLSLTVGGSNGTVTGLTRSAAASGAKTYTSVSSTPSVATVTNTLAMADTASTTTGTAVVVPVSVGSSTITFTESTTGITTTVAVTVASGASLFGRGTFAAIAGGTLPGSTTTYKMWCLPNWPNRTGTSTTVTATLVTVTVATDGVFSFPAPAGYASGAEFVLTGGEWDGVGTPSGDGALARGTIST